MSDDGASAPSSGPAGPPPVPPEHGGTPAPGASSPSGAARERSEAPAAGAASSGPPAQGPETGTPGEPSEASGREPPSVQAPPPGGEAGPPYDDAGLEESFLTIWLQPRATIRRIVTRDTAYWVVPLAAIAGTTQVLSSATSTLYAGITLGQVLLAAVAGGPVLGIFTLYVGAWLTRRAGQWWLHGYAGPEEMRAALAWAGLPHVVALPLWLLATAAFGLALYTEPAGELTARSPVYVLFATVATALQIWSLFIASAGVAEVQGYRSAWKGFWNLILGGLLLLALVIAGAIAIGILIAVASGVLG